MSCIATIYTVMLFGVFPTSLGIVTDISPFSIPRKEPRSASKSGLFCLKELWVLLSKQGFLPLLPPPPLGLGGGGLLGGGEEREDWTRNEESGLTRREKGDRPLSQGRTEIWGLLFGALCLSGLWCWTGPFVEAE